MLRYTTGSFVLLVSPAHRPGFFEDGAAALTCHIAFPSLEVDPAHIRHLGTLPTECMGYILEPSTQLPSPELQTTGGYA